MLDDADLGAMLESIGANVRRLRVRAGLTQERLAERVDLDLTFLQRIERGKTNLGVAVLLRLATALDVKPAALLRSAKLPKARRGRPPTKRPPLTK